MEIVQSSYESMASHTPAQLQSTPLESSSSEASEQQGINFRPLLRIVRRNALLILGATALTTGLAYWLSLAAAPLYQGNLRLLVEPVTPERRLSDPGVVARGDDRARQQSSPLDYATQLVILQSSGLLSDVVEQVQASFPDFRERDLRKGLTVERCCSGDGVGGIGGQETRILEVTYEDSDPQRADLVLELISNRFLRYSLEERKSSISEGVRFIDEQLPALENRVSLLQSQIQSLQEQYLLTDPQAQGAQLSTQLADLSNQKMQTDSLLQEQVTLYRNLQTQLGLSPNQALASSTLSEDPGYQNLLRQREEVESQIAVESAFYNEASPVIQALRDQQNELSSLQERRAREVLGSAFGELNGPQMLAYQNSIRSDLIQQMVNSANEIQVLQARSNALEQANSSAGQRVQQFPAIARRYAELQRELLLATQTLDRLLAQRETLQVEAAQNEFPWDLISSSQVPRDVDGNPVPEEGKLPRNMALGLFAGLMAGIGGAVLTDRSKNAFLDLADLEEETALPILATIPYCEEAVRLQQASTAVLLDKADRKNGANFYSFTNSFNSAYAKIRLSPSAESIKSIVIASACPQDGKSTLALNLAKAALLANQRVLLVDANLQSPQLHQILSLTNSSGLSEVLLGELSIEDAIEPVPHTENLFAIPAGQSLSRSSKLLASNQMNQLVQKLHNSFDLVIYDTPSFQESSDVSFLTSYASSSLIVVGIRKTDKSVVNHMMQEFREFNLPCFGIVANYV
ncbi:GumC family protein [Nodosilinea sp. E11]|uniref:GumC family protein n=1 Tax=Nodosilinea sp. E11 TaxID=3037479 RepID=UPI00293434F3|nr:AAA family ATPase [Nodosilinea sp. E11]WOD38908.1 AAA family ATPase [Nodosilinea sp. E11]